MIETKEKRQKKIRDDRKIARKRWEEEKETAINLGLPMPKKPRTKVFQITLLSRKVYVLLGTYILSRHGAMFNNQCSISFQLTCSYCENDKGGFEGSEYDRHLIAVHSYDYCKLCWVMGPRNSVRLHIATTHPKKVFLRQQQGSKNDVKNLKFPYFHTIGA